MPRNHETGLITLGEKIHVSVSTFSNGVDQQGLVFWDEIRFEHIQAYKKSLIDRRLAFDTIRLYLVPVRRTSTWMTSNWPRLYSNICIGLRLSKHDVAPAKYDDNYGNPYLPLPQVVELLDWLSRSPIRDRLTAGVALQGLAGLQMQEALRLTWENVDFENETITIDGVVKNRFRIRKNTSSLRC